VGTIPTVTAVTAGSVATAAQFNAIKAAIDFWALTPRCYAYGSATQSLTTATYTMLALGAEVFDIVQSGDTAMHDNTTDNSRITIRTPGKYALTGQISYASNATGVRKCLIVKNGTTVLAEADIPAIAGGITSVVGAGPVIVPLAAGDYVELQAYQSSGGALATDVSFVGSTWVQVVLDSA